MNLVMQVRAGGNARIPDIPDYLALLDVLPARDAEGLQVRVTRIESVLVLDDYVIAEPRIVLGGCYLAVGCRQDRVPGAVGGQVYALVDIPLAGKGMPVLAERHRHVADPAPDGPEAGNVGKQRALGIEKLSDLLDGLNRVFKITGKVLKFGNLANRALGGFLYVEERGKVPVLDIALEGRGRCIHPDKGKGSGKRGLEILRGLEEVPGLVLELVKAGARGASLLLQFRERFFRDDSAAGEPEEGTENTHDENDEKKQGKDGRLEIDDALLGMRNDHDSEFSASAAANGGAEFPYRTANIPKKPAYVPDNVIFDAFIASRPGHWKLPFKTHGILTRIVS